MTEIDKTLAETITVAPNAGDADRRNQGDAGNDESIAERLHRNPSNKEARLDRALDESMDASDPPSSTQPIHNRGPAPSSGYDEDTEKARRDNDR